MKSVKHVFISFKTEDLDAAKKMKDALNKKYEVWFQVDLQCGHAWAPQIDTAIENAGALVVLWSHKSFASPWVRHEASQAIAKKIYTPVLIEVMSIDSPFDTIQATDITNWQGEDNHPGFQNLLRRLEELMPQPLSKWALFKGFMRKNLVAAVFIFITLLSFASLYKLSNKLGDQAKDLKNQVQNQAKIFDSIKVQSQLQRDQTKQQTLVLSNIDSQGIIIKEQLITQSNISKNVDKTVSSLKAILYPLDSLDLSLSFAGSITEESLKFLTCETFIFEKGVFSKYYRNLLIDNPVAFKKTANEVDEQQLFHFNCYKPYEPKNTLKKILNRDIDVKLLPTYSIKNVLRYPAVNLKQYSSIYDLTNEMLFIRFRFTNGKPYPKIKKVSIQYGSYSAVLNGKLVSSGTNAEYFVGKINSQVIDGLLNRTKAQ